VAQRWRIRHKLLLGLGLVLGAFALMLTGTVQSLTSYMETMKVLDNKLAEKDEAEAFQEAVKYLFDLPPTFNIDDEEVQLRQRMANAQSR